MAAAIKAVIVCDHQVLLFLRDNKPECKYPLHWQIVGGAVEEGETPEQALKREVKEETSYEIKDFTYLETVIGSQGEDVYRYLIKVDKKDKDKFKIGPGEGLEVKFFSLEDSLNLILTPGTRKFFEEKLTDFESWTE